MLGKLTLFVLLFSLFVTVNAKEINLDTLASNAAKAKKHLLVWLHKTDCGYCEAMQEFTLEEPSISKALKHDFILLPINVYDSDTITYKQFNGSAKAFAKSIGYNFYPSSIFLDGSAQIVFAAPGFIEEKDFAVMLQYVSSRAYTTLSYDAYQQQQEEHQQ
jgi:thioredoxin-related protein